MVGERVVEIIEGVLSDEISVREALKELERLKSTEKNKITCAIRLVKAYENQSYLDFCGHLRQVIIYYGYPIKIENRIFNKFVYNNMKDFGLNIVGDKTNIKFSANPVILPKEDKISGVYKYEQKVYEKPAIGDGKLYNFTKFKTYKSFAQKILINRISKMQFGDTMLACLPTGAGKSLSWQLPGISNEYNGLIIVIVPTIALAINHEQSSKKMFQVAGINGVYPKAYYSGKSIDEKKKIKQEIMAGILPILYISPEALMQKEFKNMIIDAAKENKISMLVVDEAHLIVDWGGGFRPEFQLIPSFRNSINKTGNKIKTILLSATITSKDATILKSIFNDDNNFIEYRADALRPEITYKVSFCENDTHRIQILKQLINQVPRPVIIYCSLVEYAENFYNVVKDLGFNNTRLFTGKTSTNDRKIIMNEWDKDDVDIIVATSAFGMGVDKSDIRTIIHTFMPENISRFYQESGRAGRDGYSAIDYCLLVNKDDKLEARKRGNTKLATTDTIVKRWFDMKINSKIEGGDCMWLDTHTTPSYLIKNITGEQSASWNKDTILFLYRNKFIDILDVSLKDGKDYFIKVKLLNRAALQSVKKLAEQVEPCREVERKYIEQELNVVFELFSLKYCFSNIFKLQYNYTKELCNGCPYCEKIKREPYFAKSDIQIFSKNIEEIVLDDDIANFLIYNQESVIICDKYNEKLDDLIAYLLQEGIHNFIIPRLKFENLTSIYDKMKYFSNIKDYILLDKTEFEYYDIKDLISGPIAIMLDDNQEVNKELFDFAEGYKKKNGNTILFISKSDVIDTRYGKIITDTEKFPVGKLENILGGK